MMADIETTYRYEVSVVIVTYNSIYEKTIKTIESILAQKDVNLEIIVADDGSRDNNMDLLKVFFEDRGFQNYKLVANRINQGTVRNFISGLKVSEGKYVKSISPGDYLYGNSTLRQWIDFLKQKKSQWSFAEAIYYQQIDGQLIPVSVNAHPLLMTPYIKEQTDQCRWNYVVLRDNALGSVMLGETSVILSYCEKISKNGIIYTEDTIFGLMMFDGIVGVYYPNYVVLYEYGTGISTHGDSVWGQRIKDDWSKAELMIEESTHLDNYQMSMVKAIKRRKGNYFSKLLVKGMPDFWYHSHFNYRKSINYFPK